MFIKNVAKMGPGAPTGEAPGGQTGNDDYASNPTVDPNNPGGYEEGGEEGGEGYEEEDGDQFDLNTLDPRAQKYIKQLRQEAAQRRTESNQLRTQFEDIQNRLRMAFGEDEEGDPSEHLNQLQEQAHGLAFQNAVLQLAVSNGVPSDGIPYMQFLIQQATDSLDEGEELDEESLAEIMQEVRNRSGAPAPLSRTSVNAPRHPGQGGGGGVTQEQFNKMGIAERTKIFRNNPELYERLSAQSKNAARQIKR